MSVTSIVFAFVLIACAVLLIAVVMLQTNRGSDMTALTGRNSNASGKGQSAKRETRLKQLTVIFGLVFVVAVFVMNIVISAGVA